MIGVSRANGCQCMACAVLGRAVTPRPWQTHTQSSVDQLGVTTHLVSRLRSRPKPRGLRVRVTVEEGGLDS